MPRVEKWVTKVASAKTLFADDTDHVEGERSRTASHLSDARDFRPCRGDPLSLDFCPNDGRKLVEKTTCEK